MRKIILLILFLPLFSVMVLGNVDDINFDITPRPYYMSEIPIITGYIENTENESYEAYVIINITTPNETIYNYRSDKFFLDISYSFPINFTYLATEGVGKYEVRAELWKSDSPDELLDAKTDSFYVVFEPLGIYEEYLVDDEWHHPSDPFILDWAVQALGGWANTQEQAAKKLKTFVRYNVVYSSAYSCDGINASCRERSTDYWIIFDKKGTCNDYADLYISFARALNIPTGYVIGYRIYMNPPNPAWMFPDYGPQQLQGGWGHAWAESFINNTWKHVGPLQNVYDDPSVYKFEDFHLIVRRQNNYSDDGWWTNLENWEDVTRVTPYDDTWQDAVLNLSIVNLTSEPVFVGDTISVMTFLNHSGDMTARNSYLSLSNTSGLILTSGNYSESLGNINWIYPGSFRQWEFNTTKEGGKEINFTLASNDTLPVIKQIFYNVLQPPSVLPSVTNIGSKVKNEQFYLSLILTNDGGVLADCVSATINLPEGLNLTENNQTQSTTIGAKNYTNLLWGITPLSLGDYTNQINISVDMNDSCNYGYKSSSAIITGLFVVNAPVIPPSSGGDVFYPVVQDSNPVQINTNNVKKSNKDSGRERPSRKKPVPEDLVFDSEDTSDDLITDSSVETVYDKLTKTELGVVTIGISTSVLLLGLIYLLKLIVFL